MAHPTIALIEGLRKAAGQLRSGAYYAWGNHGACNCGHLLQATTRLSPDEIRSYAHTGIGEWTEIAQEACPVTGAPITLLLSKLETIGLTPTDIHNIEYLEDREVLKHLPGGFRWLKRNVREDVVVYFETMAALLEDKLGASLQIHLEQLMSPMPELA
ncbi:hypothetical protein [Paraflavitalea sp. CAU 1676]|uniref:hypothetical protein n=1 Tax=Paraflavitalea sp. CAU 1676 TaxID=3032598 RepID=UPI0023D9D49B|nr:hypothetical protein [Paraflavitalea sp. CAU 1676]MDF2187370.1 hypothetical protein [Paraflavitalea sp. CAU 1676]